MSIHGFMRPPRLFAFVLVRRFFERHGLLRATAAALVFAASLQLSSSLFSSGLLNDGVAVYWPVTAMVVAVMLVSRRRLWPWILVVFVLVQALGEREPPLQVAIDVTGSVAEILVVAFALPAFTSLEDWLREPKLARRFVLYALLFGPATFGTAAGLYAHLALRQPFWDYTIRFTLADALGMALGLPLLLVLRSRETYDLFRPKALVETLGLLGLLCILSWLIFSWSPYPLAFAIMPLLLRIALRLGFSGSIIAVNLLTVIASVLTLQGKGPFPAFIFAHHDYRIALLQLFLTLSMTMCLPVSITLLERRRFEAQLKAAYLRMELVATQDGLTGLANRRRFDLSLEEAWRRAMRDGRPIALLMVDADCFKLYNDSYGHLAGDECLRRVADAIHSVPQRSSDLAARYGGEEFAVLLPYADMNAALEVAALIRFAVASMNLPHQHNEHGMVTVSIGCGVAHPRPGDAPTLLIKRADEALYAAKQKGRNRIEAWFHASPALQL